MAQPSKLEQIRKYWDLQATTHGLSPTASWADQNVIDMEIRTISPYLQDGDEVLDIGCANGYSTVHYAMQHTIHIQGIDYVPEMIQNALVRLENIKDQLIGQIEFSVGDILKIELPPQKFNKIISTRMVINVGDWANQLYVLRKCVQALRPGGLLLLSEATMQGWQRMNTFRAEWGLSPIPIPEFNNYLDESQLIGVLAPDMDFLEIVNFSSTYFVGTRVFKPLIAQLNHMAEKIADPLMEWNRWFAQLPSIGDYGTQKLFVFRKK
jgi:2-polyprenyl-3-methyl-5-hydroxy-6-metoxy-1,4-benzoquinol methylase